MTAPPLTDGAPAGGLAPVIAERLDALSFFTVTLAVAAVGVHLLLRASGRRGGLSASLAATLLLAVGSSLGITLLSGARELLGPGAWDRSWSPGPTYTAEEQLRHARRVHLVAFATTLEAHRRATGAYPAEVTPPPSLHPSGAPLLYRGPDLAPGELLALEPTVYGSRRLGALAGRGVEWIDPRSPPPAGAETFASVRAGVFHATLGWVFHAERLARRVEISAASLGQFVALTLLTALSWWATLRALGAARPLALATRALVATGLAFGIGVSAGAWLHQAAWLARAPVAWVAEAAP